MSINALSNAALARRVDFEPAGRAPSNLSELATAAGGQPAPVNIEGGAGLGEAQATGANTALQTLTTYIPTEVLTLYVSALAVLKTDQEQGRWIPFWCFLAATPILVWIAFATKVKMAKRPIPASPSKWPLWEMCAGAIAYIAWAFALPNTPFAQLPWYSAGLAGFLVLVVSTGLGVLAPLMQRALPS
jgi:hypothetical protein